MKRLTKKWGRVLAGIMCTCIVWTSSGIFVLAEDTVSQKEESGQQEAVPDAPSENVSMGTEQSEGTTQEEPRSEDKAQDMTKDKSDTKNEEPTQDENILKPEEPKAAVKAGAMTTLDISKGNITITASSVSGADENGNPVTAANPDGYIITGDGGTNIIKVTGAKTSIILDGVSISTQAASSIPMQISGSADIKLLLKGTNSLQTSSQRVTALQVDAGSSLTIDSAAGSGLLDGTLSSKNTSGVTFNGFGIGSAQSSTAGNITILGGTIDALGGVGIGGQPASKITISGGNVTAEGSYNGAGIGGYTGNCGTTLINGGTVKATGGRAGAAIGNGAGGTGGSVTITGNADVTATGGFEAAGIGIGQTGESIDIVISGNPTISVSGGRADIGNGGQKNMTGGSILISGGTIHTLGTGNTAIGDADTNRGQSRSKVDITITGGDITGDNTVLMVGNNITVETNSPIDYSKGGYVDAVQNITVTNSEMSIKESFASASGNIIFEDSNIKIAGGYGNISARAGNMEFTDSDIDIDSLSSSVISGLTSATAADKHINITGGTLNVGPANSTSKIMFNNRYGDINITGNAVVKGAGGVRANDFTMDSGHFENSTNDYGFIVWNDIIMTGGYLKTGNRFAANNDIRIYDGYLSTSGNLEAGQNCIMGKTDDGKGGNAVIFTKNISIVVHTDGTDTNIELNNGILFWQMGTQLDGSHEATVFGDVTLDWLADAPGQEEHAAGGHGSTLEIPSGYHLYSEVGHNASVTVPDGKTIVNKSLFTTTTLLKVEAGGAFVNDGIVNNHKQVLVENGGKFTNNKTIWNFYKGYFDGDGEKINNTGGTVKNEIWFNHINKDNVEWTGYPKLSLKNESGKIEEIHVFNDGMAGTDHEGENPAPVIWAENGDSILQLDGEDTTKVITSDWSWKQEPLDFYTLTFSGNYKNAPAIADTYLALNGATYKGQMAADPARDNYEFLSWNTKADGTGTTVNGPDDIVALAAPTVLYAQWNQTATEIYTIKYDTQGGDIIADKTGVEFNDANLIPAADPARDGYTFVGWKYGDLDVLADTTYSSLTGDETVMGIILTAKWTELTDYSVLYNTNGGSMPKDTPSSVTGMKYSDVVPSPVPIREGYAFKGWTYKDAPVAEGTAYSALAGDDTVKQIELVAQWEINQYTVDFKFTSDKNPDGITAPGKLTVEYGKVIEGPKFTAPANWTFDGWYIDKECTQKYDFNNSVKADVILYGNWTYKTPEKPADPGDPAKPSKPSNPSKPTATNKPVKNTAQTGDMANTALFGLLMAASFALLFWAAVKRRKHVK